MDAIGLEPPTRMRSAEDLIDLEVLSMDEMSSPAPRRATVVGVDAHPAGADFDELYQREYPAMVRLSYLLVQDRDLAVEVTHDAFVKVLERWNRLDRPGAYLRTAVVNASKDALRRRIFRRSREHIIAVTDRPLGRDDYLADALAALQPKRRAAIVLRYYLDLSEAEIADTLGVRPGTVKSLLHRGLADLRDAFAEPTARRPHQSEPQPTTSTDA